MRAYLLALFCITAFLAANVAFAQMTSTNYEIRWDSVGFGGSDTSSSASYQLRDTIGSVGAGQSTSTSYILDSGYRAGIFDQIITFELFIQGTTVTTASALSSTTVTVADTSGFSVGDKIVIIQDRGTSQVAGVGEVTGIAGSDITVDAIEDGAGSVSVDGTDDYVYLMDASSVNYGDVSDSEVVQSIVGWEVSIDMDGGYTVSVVDDGNLRSGSNDIDDVTDGSVTAGSEEYGGRSSDSTLASSTFDTEDAAFTTSYQQVGTESDAIFTSRDFLTLKAARSSSSTTGTYSHTLSLIASGNY